MRHKFVDKSIFSTQGVSILLQKWRESKLERVVLKKKFVELLASAEVLEKQKHPKIVVSLTTYGHRIEKTAPLTIASLLNQTLKPDEIVVWLAYGDRPSRMLKKLSRYGVNIMYTKDIKSYKKLIPTLSVYPDSALVTVDDDMIYPKRWLEEMVQTYNGNPGAIIVNRARRILVNEGRVAPYVQWPLLSTDNCDPRLIMPTGAGGVLYPPGALDERVNNEEEYMNLAPHADDLWFWAMSELKSTRRVMVENGFSNTLEFELDNSNENRLSVLNTDPNNTDNNDTQLARILNRYPELCDSISADAKKIQY